jgi:hypothetical protein
MRTCVHNVIFLLLFLSLSMTFAVAGPPDNSSPDEKIEISKETRDSLREEALRLSHIAESLTLQQMDSLLRIDVELKGIEGLPSYNEIIIDENGIIKVMTDSGLVVISPDSLLGASVYPEGEYSGGPPELTRWGQSIIVDEGERIISDIIVISGDVTVNGTVEGDILVIGGNIYINATGYVRGDATAVGGRVKKEEGAKVTGTSLSIGIPLFFIPRGSWMQVFTIILLLIMAISLFFSALSLSLFQKPIKRITEQLLAHPLKSFLFGYLLYIGGFLVWILLLVSVIGIPLAFLGQPVAMLIIVIFSYAALNVVLGEKIFKEPSSIKSFFFGCLITTAVPFLFLILGYLTNLLVLFIFNMIFLSFLLFILLPFGLGATVLARFGFSSRKKGKDAVEGGTVADQTA